LSTVLDVIADQAVRSVFQPIVDLDSGCVVGYEALARGPLGSDLETPASLFGSARRLGALAALDDACRIAAFRGALRCGLLAPLTLFVNVEPEVLDTAPLDDLLAIAASAPRELRVVFEITERSLGARPAELLRTVERIRKLGWQIALDDVGADPASLVFMPLLRPEVVKLDLRFAQDRPGPEMAAVMHAVSAYAEQSGALVLAEGIEDERHLAMARGFGARLGQGWLFGRPEEQLCDLPVGELPVPRFAPDLASATSPFGVLPAVTPLRVAAKGVLIELSKTLEREALGHGSTAIIASTFQEAHHFTPATARRYAALAGAAGFVCVLGAGMRADLMPGVRGANLTADDPVRDEWDVVVLTPHFAAALLARDLGDAGPDIDRRFSYALTYNRDTVVRAAGALLSRIVPAGDALPLTAVEPLRDAA
jgi:EAL domain-containing protein (putative c-di-GMP-specific phosphodiesterase class I)